MSQSPKQLGTLSALSIGIGGMVGGGIFATTGLAVELTRGGVPIAFVVSGLVALATSYSYLKLTLRFPSEGGTVEFINRGFGAGFPTGAANVLLCLSYTVLIAVYAYAFGSYAASFFPADEHAFWRHAFLSGAIVSLAVLNFFGGSAVVRSENAFNAAKIAILVLFVIAGLLGPIEWQRLEPEEYVRPLALLSGAMIVFFNYEGFELISNAAPELKDPRRSLPIAYVGGVLICLVLYVLIVVVVVGHVAFSDVARVSDYALSAAAARFLGAPGHVMVATAALLATVSAISATFYGLPRLVAIMARSRELPAEVERRLHGRRFEALTVFALLSLILANFVPLHAIATMGSAGFLLIFLAVNAANVRLAHETGSRRWISALGALLCASAIAVLCIEIDEDPATHGQIWVLLGMVGISAAIEALTRRLGRSARVR